MTPFENFPAARAKGRTRLFHRREFFQFSLGDRLRAWRGILAGELPPVSPALVATMPYSISAEEHFCPQQPGHVEESD